MPITPAKEPVPALRWKLLPDLRDTTPGNAVTLYYRAFNPEWWSQFRRDPKNAEALTNAMTMPLAEVRESAQREPGLVGWVRDSAMLREVDRAARRQYCDWNLIERVREEGLRLLIPDVQAFRSFALFLAARARLELADGDFNKAVQSIQTGLSLGRHVGDAPTLIQSLVGIAISGAMLQQVEEWVRTPDSPNLYWALAQLPQPFVDMGKPMQGEKLVIDHLLPGFREALATRSAEKLGPVTLADYEKKLYGTDTGATPDSVIAVMKAYPAAKEFLRSEGWAESAIENLSAFQAVMLREVAIYDRTFDQMAKWVGLPRRESLARTVAADRARRSEELDSELRGTSLVAAFLPAVSRIAESSNRIDRKIAALRCIEAIRLHAAEHGRLPATLADITAVPVPRDAATGNAFEYTSNGQSASLIAPPPDGKPTQSNTMKYDITIRK